MTTDVNQIERNFKKVQDIRNEATNERTSIYEVGKFRHYVMIQKKAGEVIKISHAQNCIALILNNVNK